MENDAMFMTISVPFKLIYGFNTIQTKSQQAVCKNWQTTSNIYMEMQ